MSKTDTDPTDSPFPSDNEVSKWIDEYPHVTRTIEAHLCKKNGVVWAGNTFAALHKDVYLNCQTLDLKKLLRLARKATFKEIKLFLFNSAERISAKESIFDQKIEKWQEKYPNLLDTDFGEKLKMCQSLKLYYFSLHLLEKCLPETRERIEDYIDRIEFIAEWFGEQVIKKQYAKKFGEVPLLSEYEDIS